MLVKLDMADGMVAGAVNSTANVLRPSLQILKPHPEQSLSAHFCDVRSRLNMARAALLFADSGLVENPDADAVSEIAISSAASFEQLVGKQAKVAMLSYSTYGSAKSELVEKCKVPQRLQKKSA